MRTKKQLPPAEKEVEIAASTALRYSDSPKDKSSSVRIKIGQNEREINNVYPIDNKVLDKLRI